MGIHGGKILSEKLKKGKTSNLPIKAKLTQDNIKSRNYDLAREENLESLKTEKDLRILQKRLDNMYEFKCISPPDCDQIVSILS